VRVGVYSDMVYRHDGHEYTNDRAFVRFIASLPPRVEEVVLFGRLDPEPGRSAYPLGPGVRFVALPYYRKATAIGSVLRAVRGSAATFSAELERLDAVWLFGPQPMSMVFGAIARRRGTPLILGVRHDYPQYIANRLPSPRWRWAIPVARAMDAAFQLLARRAPTVALGEEIARHYRRGAAPVMTTGFSLVPRAEVRPLDEALAKEWEGPRTILTVSRLDPEKNPLLLLDILHGLRARDPRWTMRIAGSGPMRGQLESRIRQLGLGDAVELLGEVANGPDLWRLYRECHLFLHVSFTEGLPQVLLEAQAAGAPIVATDVGGVAEALGGGAQGLLVPPADAAAAVAAVERVAGDAALRARLIEAGLRHAAQETLEAQLDRLTVFISDAVTARA
jgi:glycosyltransferase involved in cell wall biosynthesis